MVVGRAWAQAAEGTSAAVGGNAADGKVVRDSEQRASSEVVTVSRTSSPNYGRIGSIVRSMTAERQYIVTKSEQVGLPCASVGRKSTPVGGEELQRLLIGLDPSRSRQHAGVGNVPALRQTLRAGLAAELAAPVEGEGPAEAVAAVRTGPGPVRCEGQDRVLRTGPLRRGEPGELHRAPSAGQHQYRGGRRRTAGGACRDRPVCRRRGSRAAGLDREDGRDGCHRGGG